MAKTVLEYVQACLSAMESDNVDTINDTVEATDAASLLKEVYYELVNRQDWPFLRKPLTLTALADAANPTGFTIGENVKLIESLYYNISTTGGYVRRPLVWCEPEDFLCRTQVSEDASDAQQVTLGSGVTFFVRTDQWPQYWTTFDDVTVVMDAVHQDYDSTLMGAKLTGWGYVIPDFTVDDDFEPFIPTQMMPLLQAEFNRRAFKLWKQIESTSDEEIARRQLSQGRRTSSKHDRPVNVFYRNAFGRPLPGR